MEEVLAVNLKHEALKGEAEGRFDEEVAKIAQKNASLAAQEDAIQNDKIAMSGRSQQDIDYAFEQQGKRYNSRMRSLDDFNNRASVSRSRHSLLKNPALAAGNQTSTAKSDQSDGIWYRIKRSVSGLFSGDEIKPEVKTIEINSSFQTAIINVSKGEEITVAASGKINLGFFAGSGDPNGIDGFETYSRVYNLRHGSLIGRFGNGDWFSVGTIKTITAPIDAPLELTVNDNDSGNNQGSFKVEISTKK